MLVVLRLISVLSSTLGAVFFYCFAPKEIRMQFKFLSTIFLLRRKFFWEVLSPNLFSFLIFLKSGSRILTAASLFLKVKKANV